MRPRRELDVAAGRRVAADLLSRRPWTCAELRGRLARRGAPPDVAAAVVADLEARGHLDDAAFARQWVQTRSGRGQGPVRLRADLLARGVARPLIDAALGELAADSVLDRARAAAARRWPALQRGGPERAASRLRDHLLRRGYPSGVVARVVRERAGLSEET